LGFAAFVITLGQDRFELDLFAGIFSGHAVEIIDECLLAVAYSGIVLNVFAADVQLDSFGRLHWLNIRS
jgi:hypothetical protein